ncbi:MAG: nitrate ABC transporter permease [Capsulimonas sp.]|uniref:ABC transporter permease n=1 Tax=Capsulimonas sp. TaxID=2494211 RepID=UPI0032645089
MNEADPNQKSAAPEPILAGAPGQGKVSHGDLGPRQRSRRWDAFAAFMPNRLVSNATMQLIVIVELAIALILWIMSPFKALPRPMETLHALQTLWMGQGLGQELGTSFKLNVEALLWSSVISLLLAYSTVLPVFRPLVTALSKGRFLSIVGFTFVFTLIFGGGHPLKLSLLIFSISVFYITSMAAVIAAIPKGDFDHARTLRMSEWRVVWEVVILGTADKAFEVLRQNAAMGWMMLTMVEGIVRSEGGVGAMLLGESKHFLLPEVFAIQIVILLMGLVQDYAIGFVRRLVCPYADLTLERK